MKEHIARIGDTVRNGDTTGHVIATTNLELIVETPDGLIGRWDPSDCHISIPVRLPKPKGRAAKKPKGRAAKKTKGTDDASK